MSRPNLPIIALERGAWRAELYDPRPDPAALGARYVHGCYVRALMRGDDLITARIAPNWSRFDGEGLPETFETGLGWDQAPMGEEYLRIGAGRLRRPQQGPRENVALSPLVTTLDWTVVAHSRDRLVMATEDAISGGPCGGYGYRLEREVALAEDGLVSTTRLWARFEKAWAHPLAWYAHPFIRQDAVDAIALEFPEGAEPQPPLVRDAEGRWRMTEDQGRAEVTGLWGARGAVRYRRPAAHGGATLAMELDRPIDHVVVFATAQACSAEPKLVHVLTRGDRMSCSVSYRLRD